jgi:hypothetical protein
MQLLNGGTIWANQSTGMVLDTSNRNLTNQSTGLLQATGTGGMYINSALFQNLGTVSVGNGSSLSMNPSNVYDTNNQGNELYQGTWIVKATTGGATLQITGGAVVTDSAAITLSGAGSAMQAWTGSWTNIENTLTTITTVGSLNVLAMRNYTTTNAIADSGTLSLGGGMFQAGGLSVGAGGLLSGYGTVKDAVANAGAIRALGTGKVLDVTGAVGGGGNLQIGAGATLELGGASAQGVTYLSAGIGDLKLDAPASFTGMLSGLAIGDAITFTGSTVSAVSVVGGTTIDVTLNGATNLSYVSAASLGTEVFTGVGTSTITLATGSSSSHVGAAFVAPMPAAAPAVVPTAAAVSDLAALSGDMMANAFASLTGGAADTATSGGFAGPALEQVGAAYASDLAALHPLAVAVAGFGLHAGA